MSLRSKLALAATPLTLALASCGSSPEPTAYEPEQVQTQTVVTPSRFKVEPIEAGNFLGLADGSYKLTMNRDAFGTNSEVECLLITQKSGSFGGVGGNSARAVMSCNWDKANQAPPAP